MDPNHRDRVAFLRLCSGRFRRGMKLKQSGTGKTIGVHNPILFFAQERETVDEAWPGDIIGIPNHGMLRVGDTLSESGERRLHRHSQFRAGNPAPRAPGRSDEAEASGARAGKPRRRRRDASVQARRSARNGSSAWWGAAARRAEDRACAPNTASMPIWKPRLTIRRAGSPAAPAEIEKFADVQSRRHGAPTATARRCSSPRAPGNWVMSPTNSPK